MGCRDLAQLSRNRTRSNFSVVVRGVVAVRYVEEMKKATQAEFDKEEAEWRENAERQVLHLCEIVDPLPTPEELDELDPDVAIGRIEIVVENNTQLCFAVDGDTRSWGEMAVARVKARTKAKTRAL
jgi:hypothetical protein